MTTQTLLVLLAIASSIPAQSGGGFEITDAVIAPSGGQSSNGNVTVDVTAGQGAAGGAMASGMFSVTSGFWNFTQLSPTAAHVSISGRVLDPAGNGVGNAVLYMHSQDGTLRLARSSPFGYYQFEGVAAGQTVLVTVSSKRYTYTPRTVGVSEDIVDLDFFPEPPGDND